jgi:hypothetical protein
VEEIFESCVRRSGDLAGVFEFDGETSYFYLYSTKDRGGEKVLSAIHILTGPPDFTDSDVSVRWDERESKVGLFIRGTLWAMFDLSTGAKDGGGYAPQGRPQLPEGASAGF